MKIKILVLNINDIGGIERVALSMLAMFKKEKSLSNVEIISVNGKSNSNCITILEGKNENVKLYSFAKTLDSNTIVFSLYDRFSIKLAFIRKFTDKKFKLHACQHADYFAHKVTTRFLRRISYPWLDIIIALTKTDYDLYKKSFPNVRIIPNVLGFYPTTVPALSKRMIDCAAAGRLVPIKQYDHYYRFLSYVEPLKAKNEFRLYGDGPESKPLAQLLNLSKIKSQDVQVGSVQDIYSELSNTKFFFVTSMRESFSMVILEAMACGCVVISYDCPTGPRELIEHGVNGFLVNANDVEGLASYYKKLFNDLDTCQKISDNARLTALKYIESNVLNMWKDVCES